MLMARVIPVLHVKGPSLVKGIHLEGLRVLGRPEAFAQHYYEQGADELVFLDIVASLYGRNNLHEIVERVADQVFIPLTVGGGVRSVADAVKLLRAGADKIAVNTAAVRRPQLLHELAQVIGCQAVVLYVEAKHRRGGSWDVLTDNAREASGREVGPWVQEAVDLGAGEVLLCSVDRDGTGSGYDLDLTLTVSTAVRVPVIALGGAGNPEHCLQALVQGRADAVAAASLFHYTAAKRLIPGGEGLEGNTEYLEGRRGGEPRYQGGLRHVKDFLTMGGVAVRGN